MELPIEPTDVYPEDRFEASLTDVIRRLVAGRGCTIVPRFGLDVAVFCPQGGWFFVEAKSYMKQRPGAVGFGNQKGQGSQVELLLLHEAELARFDKTVRWAFADATKPAGSKRYGLFTNLQAKRAAMGDGVEKGKQNNFRVSSFEPGLVDWPSFCAALQAFLAITQPAA